MASRVSAGILLHRLRSGRLEVLLGHPGGPFMASRDAGYWSIPKGEAGPGEALEAVALREFEEETGQRLAADGLVGLGTIRQKGGKLVHGWAIAGDLDAATSVSNTFTMEWPPGSGRLEAFPELDRVEWFTAAEARRRIKETQIPFIDRLEAALSSTEG